MSPTCDIIVAGRLNRLSQGVSLVSSEITSVQPYHYTVTDWSTCESGTWSVTAHSCGAKTEKLLNAHLSLLYFGRKPRLNGRPIPARSQLTHSNLCLPPRVL